MQFYTAILIGIGCLLQLSSVICKFSLLNPATCGDYNRSYLRKFSMRMDNSILNVELDLISPFFSGLQIDMDFMGRKSKSKNYRSFYRYTMDMCSIMNYQKNNMFKRWLSGLLAYGNINRPCPMPPNRYYIRNYDVNNLAIPTFLFAGDYRISFHIVQNRDKEKRKDFIIECVLEIEIK